MKKKILILINTDVYLRNYIRAKAFTEIEKKYDCYYSASTNGVTLLNDLKRSKNFIGSIFYQQKNIKKFNTFVRSSFFKNKKKSTSIYIESKKRVLKPRFVWENENFFKIILMFPLRLASFFSRMLFFLASRYLSFIFSFEYTMEINKGLLNIISKLNPDLIIIPMTEPCIEYYDTMRISKNKIPSLGLIDNWDNVSSRGSFGINSDYLGVWGKQTKQHAIKYQNFISKNVFPVGTSRFDNYFSVRNTKIKSNFKFKYFLFLESFYNPDNIIELKIIDNLISKNKIFKNFKIVYRPHPWQKRHRSMLNEKEFKNLIIDPQIKKNYIKRNFTASFQPELNYYPVLINNAEMIIGGPTTMLLEAAIFRKKMVILGYDNTKNHQRYTYEDEIKYLVHNKGIERIPALKICSNLNDLKKVIIKFYKKKNINKLDIDRKRRYFLYDDKYKYRERLKSVVDQIFRQN